MAGSCCSGNLKFDGISARFRTILIIVIGINATMFVVEFGAGLFAGSMALQADALDFLGDTLTYGITLLAIGHALRWRAYAAIFKGLTLALMGIWVMGSTLYRVVILGVPNEVIMGSIAALALAANLASVLLLLRYRNGDANVRSVWLCSRNDAIGNVAVLIAAAAVHQLQSAWPDLLVALLMASLFLHSAYLILSQARGELLEDSAAAVQTEVSPGRQ
jgi:Co/Zn/Cd efflux system component